MNYEQIQNFLVAPNLPDLIIVVLYIVSIIGLYFLKKFVKKDNNRIILDVDTKKTEIDRLKSELVECKKQFINETKKFEKIQSSLMLEIDRLKKAIIESSGNVKELVSRGTASKIAKDLSSDKENIEEGTNE